MGWRARKRLMAAAVALCAGGCLLAAAPASAAPMVMASGASTPATTTVAPAVAYGRQVTLPFTGLSGADGVAVDSSGDVYVADPGNSRVVEVPAGATSSSQQKTLPFTGLSGADGVAVDSSGDVYVADPGNNRVVEVPAGATSSSQQKTLPFTGLSDVRAVAVDSSGDVYVTSGISPPTVVELPATANGWGTQVTLPFTLLPAVYGYGLSGVAVDKSGNVYVAYMSNNLYDNQVVELPATANGWGAQVTLPFTGLNGGYPSGVAVDGQGNVYLTVSSGPTGVYPDVSNVMELPATATGWDTQVAVPFTGLSYPSGVAVDRHGDVYLADSGTNLVTELPVLPVAVTYVPNQRNDANQKVSLQIHAASSAGLALTYSAANLPAGLSISATTGLISGRLQMITKTITKWVTVTATDINGKTGSVSFFWTVMPVTGKLSVSGGDCASDYDYLNAPGTPVMMHWCYAPGSPVRLLLRTKWTLGPHYSLVVHGLCLTDPHWGRWGTKLVLERCTGWKNQQWRHHSNREYTVAVHGLCLADPHYSFKPGTQLIIESCRDLVRQRWTRP